MENIVKDAVRTSKKLEGAKNSKTFENYWNEDEVEKGVLEGLLIEGVLRINPKNYREAYIASPDGTEDILIEGLRNRNRALNGDCVVCILLPDDTTSSVPSSSKKIVTPKSERSLVSTPKTANGKNPKPLKSHSDSYVVGQIHKLAKKILNEGMKENLATDESSTSIVEIISTHSHQVKPAIDQLPHSKPIKHKRKKNKSIKGVQEKEDSAVADQIATTSVDKDVQELAVEPTKVMDDDENICDVIVNQQSIVKEDECVFIKELSVLNISKDMPTVTMVSTIEASKDFICEVKKKRSRRSKKKKNDDQSKDKTISSQDLPNVVDRQATAEVDSDAKLSVERGDDITSAQKATAQITAGSSSQTASRKIAKVVFIKEQRHSRRAIGQLRSWPYGQSTPTPVWILFAPKDHRIPRLKILYTKDLDAYIAQPNMLYLAKIEAWEDINHPLGSLCLCVGNSGDIEAETLALLLEHEVDYGPFPEAVFDDLPSLPWSIPSEELKNRKDYRNDCIFTIDPHDAKDLDDAVCGRLLETAEDGTRLFQISVHIADVSFFINDGTVLDEIASQRATSTYLVDRVIPMLPSVLCEHVCSLNPGEDRLAFSVEWVITEKGEIIKEWFGKSVIRSCVKLSYDHAQAVIEGREEIDWPEIKSPFTTKEIGDSIRILQEMAGHLRKKRVEQGALRIDLPRLAFSMDWATRTPIGFRLYELKESNRLIEEFMLLANMRVAEKIYKSFPSIAVLRCHPEPLKIKLMQLSNTLQTIGIFLDVTSSLTLQESLLKYSPSTNDPISAGISLVISNLLAKPMKCASYICSGLVKNEQQFRHYALSVPFYTHFTSPIRRYPDILVHRLLNAALQEEKMEHWKPPMVKMLLENCNSRKLAAKALQEKHGELHLANLIRKHGSIEVKGIVLAVLNHSIDVVFLYLGVHRRIYLEKLPLEQMMHENFNGIGKLSLIWKPDETPGSVQVHQTISVFSMLEILLVPHTENDKLDFNPILQRPSHAN